MNLAIILPLGLALSSPPAPAAAPAPTTECRSPFTGFIVSNSPDDGYTLEVEIRNDASGPARDFEFTMGPNTLRLQAVEAGSGDALVVPVALAAPNLENLVLKPGESFRQDFLLEGLIPGLKDALKRTDVRLSWILDLDPKDACVSLSARGSALLER